MNSKSIYSTEEPNPRLDSKDCEIIEIYVLHINVHGSQRFGVLCGIWHVCLVSTYVIFVWKCISS